MATRLHHRRCHRMAPRHLQCELATRLPEQTGPRDAHEAPHADVSLSAADPQGAMVTVVLANQGCGGQLAAVGLAGSTKVVARALAAVVFPFNHQVH